MTEDWSGGEQYIEVSEGILCLLGPGEGADL